MKLLKNGKQYDTDKAVLVASDRYWDSENNNFEQSQENKFLYKTPKGNFFLHHIFHFMGESECLDPLTFEEAKKQYELLGVYVMGYKDTFGEDPEEA